MDGSPFHLELRPAIRAAAPPFYVRVDGVEPEAGNAIQQRVSELLQQRLDSRTMPPIRSVTRQTERPNEGPVQVEIAGHAVSRGHHAEIEEIVRAVVAQQLSSDRAAMKGCICFSGVPGDRINLTADDIVWYDNGVWVPPVEAVDPDAPTAWIIATFLDNSHVDAARLLLQDGSTFDPPIPKNQMLVGLANDTDWAKEIWAENLCSGRLGSVQQDGTNSVPRRMLLQQPDCTEGADTVVFRKPGFLGIWEDVAHFPPELFWQAFGGTCGDYTWVFD